jgi:hypothetical protein
MEDKKFMCLMCGKDFSDREPRKRQGALNLHKRQCILKHLTKSEPENQSDHNEPAPCNHNWRLLKTNIPIEKRAIQNGYTEFCTVCQDVK